MKPKPITAKSREIVERCYQEKKTQLVAQREANIPIRQVRKIYDELQKVEKERIEKLWVPLLRHSVPRMSEC